MNIQIFNNAQFGQLRTDINQQGQPIFCLSDICNALGLTAKYIKQRLDAEFVSKHPTKDNLGRTQQALFVNEEGLYEVVLESQKPEAKDFRKWVVNEILPSLRQAATPHIDIPKDYASALRLAADQAELIQQQRQTITALQLENENLKQSSEYINDILQSPQTITTTQIAQDYGVTAKVFNRMLEALRIQYKINGQWILYAPYVNRGYVL